MTCHFQGQKSSKVLIIFDNVNSGLSAQLSDSTEIGLAIKGDVTHQ